MLGLFEPAKTDCCEKGVSEIANDQRGENFVCRNGMDLIREPIIASLFWIFVSKN